MKKLILTLMAVLTLISTCAASTVPIEDISEILSCMGIIEETGKNSITRGELAKVIVNASEYSNMIAFGRTSPFSDVMYNSEYAPYVRIAANNGFMVGYYDGEFKPNKQVTYEEAVTAILKLLGYTNSDFSLGYPYAQLKIADDIGLTDDININIGSIITKDDLSHLIYNALSCNNKNGRNYASVLGYSTTNGRVTLSDAMDNNVTGPITLKTTDLESYGLTNPTIYVNGKKSSQTDINIYDVLYYSTKSNTAWVYNEKVTGVVEAISPNKETPTLIKISGKSYNLSTYSAQKSFGLGGIEVGNMATLLLDRNGEISDAYLTENLYESQIGVIIDAGKKEITMSDGDIDVSYYATILLVNGEKIDIATASNYESKIGYSAKVTYSVGSAKISTTKKSTNIYGLVDIQNNKIGDYEISSDIKILEFDEYGNTIEVSKNRIDGVYIPKDSVSYATTNSKNEIDTMLIKEVTGDTALYSVITSSSKSKQTDSETYKYLKNYQTVTYLTTENTFDIERGPVAIYFDGQTIEKMENLTRLKGTVISVNNVYLETDENKTYKLSDKVFVYKMDGASYEEATIDDAMSGEYKNIIAYYDKTEKNGGRIRVLYLS